MFNAYTPTRVLFGVGQLANLHEQTLPGSRAMVVISNGNSGRAVLPRLQEQLSLANTESTVFDKIQPNPLKQTVMDGAAFCRDNGCDFIIALGGGSVMDASKIIAMMATNDGDLWDYVNSGTGKGVPRQNKALPVVAITTTAGTGSEVDPWGVISNPETHEKIGIGGSDDLFPVLAVVDAELMLTVPPKFTAYQGFDALFHSVEGYISLAANPLSDMYALTAIKNISSNLAETVTNGANIEAREAVAFGNTLSGYVMVVGCTTSEHSLEHAMSAYHPKLPHGAGLIMISKAYFTHFIKAGVCDERFVAMARAMGYTAAKEPMDFIAALDKMQRDCGVADLKMSEYGFEIEEFWMLAKNAHATMGSLFAADRVQLNDADCVDIFKAAYR